MDIPDHRCWAEGSGKGLEHCLLLSFPTVCVLLGQCLRKGAACAGAELQEVRMFARDLGRAQHWIDDRLASASAHVHRLNCLLLPHQHGVQPDQAIFLSCGLC